MVCRRAGEMVSSFDMFDLLANRFWSGEEGDGREGWSFSFVGLLVHHVKNRLKVN